MNPLSTLVRATATAAAAAVTGAVLVAAPAQAAPAGDSATWLSRQLTDGLVYNSQYDFNDIGLTLDTGIALKTIGGQATKVREIRRAVYRQVDSYTTGGSPTEVYSGAVAKAIVWAQVSGANPRTYGGTDLVDRLDRRVAPNGRISDQSQWGDYANVIGQAFAVRGLNVARSANRVRVIDFLLQQQCSAGYFRLNFSDPAAVDQSCDGAAAGDKAPDTDATALAVLQLDALPTKSARVQRAIGRASSWLVRTQRSNGSHTGGTSTDTPNANSTGLAAWALGSTGRCAAARSAATWTYKLQAHVNLAGTGLRNQRGAIAYDGKAFSDGKAHGITQATRDQWRRTTAQAAPGLKALGGCL